LTLIGDVERMSLLREEVVIKLLQTTTSAISDTLKMAASDGERPDRQRSHALRSSLSSTHLVQRGEFCPAEPGSKRL